MKIVDLVQGTREWKDWRRTGITSTSIAAIMEVSPWKTAYQVYEEILGLSVDYVNDAMKRGSRYEDEARRFVNRTERMNFIPRCIEGEKPYFLASLDGYDSAKNTILEIKVPSQKNYLSMKQIPLHYIYQTQWQMGCSEARSAWFFVYSPERQGGTLTILQRDDALIERMFQQATLFWNNLMKGIPPSKKTTKSDVSSLISEELIFSLKKYRDLTNAYEKYYDEVKDVLLQELEGKFGSSGFSCYGLEVSLSKPKISYDYEAMRADGIDLEKYKRIGQPYYIFSFKKEKEET